MWGKDWFNLIENEGVKIVGVIPQFTIQAHQDAFDLPSRMFK